MSGQSFIGRFLPSTKESQQDSATIADLKAQLDAALRERDEIAKTAAETLKREMLKLSETLESEVKSAVGDILARSNRLSQGATQLAEIAKVLRLAALEVTQLVETTSGNVQTWRRRPRSWKPPAARSRRRSATAPNWPRPPAPAPTLRASGSPA